MDHGIYRILVQGGDKMYRITDSSHVTFHESKFIRAPDLQHLMEDEISDNESTSEYAEIQKESSKNHYTTSNDDIAIDKFVDVDQINSDNTVSESSSSDDDSEIPTDNNDDRYHDSNDND